MNLGSRRVGISLGVLALAAVLTGAGAFLLSQKTSEEPRSLFAEFDKRGEDATYRLVMSFSSTNARIRYPAHIEYAYEGDWYRSIVVDDPDLQVTQYTGPDASWYCQTGPSVAQLCYPDPYFEEDNESELADPAENVLPEFPSAIVIQEQLGLAGVRVVDSDEREPPEPKVSASTRTIVGEEVTCIKQTWDAHWSEHCYTADGIRVADIYPDHSWVATDLHRDVTLDDFALPFPTTTAEDPQIR